MLHGYEDCLHLKPIFNKKNSQQCELVFFSQVYAVSEERKQDQVDVDKQLLNVVRQHPERKFMYSYLTSLFSLKSKEYPHKMVF